ncbi:polyribonucleotide nucleotidyltransferase [Alteribacter populi]|uniref:polyribonucleotide nucleotidyltransferase n=1 Tax=Alteribacter populi TaxID=2011011 RepID=UPI000BBB0352|nr:polyribonucleotide nucleotidyltransferase [Alteribacter populi]
MKLSSMMEAQTQQTQHTLNISLINSSLNTQAAQATDMLDILKDGTPQKTTAETSSASEPHPTLGKLTDTQV